MIKEENVIGCTRSKTTTENKEFVERRIYKRGWRIPAGIRTKFFKLLKRYTAYRHISGNNIAADDCCTDIQDVPESEHVAA
jgi:hypothetical protein